MKIYGCDCKNDHKTVRYYREPAIWWMFGLGLALGLGAASGFWLA